jgi:hypothetical protein
MYGGPNYAIRNRRILKNYGEAEAAVQDLELAGIVGNQLEVIIDIDEDARTANMPGEPSAKPENTSQLDWAFLRCRLNAATTAAVSLLRTLTRAVKRECRSTNVAM